MYDFEELYWFSSVELEAHVYHWTFNKQLILGSGGGFNYIWFMLIYLPFQAKCSSWKTVSYQRYLKRQHPLWWRHLLFPLSVTDWIRRWVCLWKCQSCVHLTAWYRLTGTGKKTNSEKSNVHQCVSALTSGSAELLRVYSLYTRGG